MNNENTIPPSRWESEYWADWMARLDELTPEQQAIVAHRHEVTQTAQRMSFDRAVEIGLISQWADRAKFEEENGD